MEIIPSEDFVQKIKECDYKTIWYALDVMVKNLDEKTALKNLPSAREDKKKNNHMIDKALEKEGIPIPNIVEIENNKEDDESSYSEDEEDQSPDSKSQPNGSKFQSKNAPIQGP